MSRHSLAIVVIARHHVDGGGQRRQQFAHPDIGGIAAIVGEIAGHESPVRDLRQGQDRLDDHPQPGLGIELIELSPPT